MFKTKLMAIASAALLTLSATSFAYEAAQQPESQAQAPAGIPNFFDPNQWFGAFGTVPAATSTELTFNAAHPSAWMKWMDPKTHAAMHMQFVNPATYAQFMQPQFFMEFMKPENMAAWMDFNQYAVMMNPQTMAYWMNPATYQHAFDPKMYAATMNPASYMAFMNPATYMGWTGTQASVQPAEAAQ